jgi:hypothetical protein
MEDSHHYDHIITRDMIIVDENEKLAMVLETEDDSNSIEIYSKDGKIKLAIIVDESGVILSSLSQNNKDEIHVFMDENNSDVILCLISGNVSIFSGETNNGGYISINNNGKELVGLRDMTGRGGIISLSNSEGQITIQIAGSQ